MPMDHFQQALTIVKDLIPKIVANLMEKEIFVIEMHYAIF
jgi:hypothetical protein